MKVHAGILLFFLVMGLAAQVRAIPPLTEGERIQLETATDHDGQVDAPALYPLLHNALSWEAEDESGAVVPDYLALYESPADYRGQAFLIEGRFRGEDSAQPVTWLVRSGPWTDRLQQWQLVVPAIQDKPIVVYLLDPPARPYRGDKVRLVGRFYKVWREQVAVAGAEDQAGDFGEDDFLVFVGRHAQVTPSAAGYIAPSTSPIAIAFGLVLAMLVAFYFLRFRLLRKVDDKPSLLERLRSARHREPEDNEDEDDEPLPADPVAALDELRKRHETQADPLKQEE